MNAKRILKYLKQIAVHNNRAEDLEIPEADSGS